MNYDSSVKSLPLLFCFAESYRGFEPLRGGAKKAYGDGGFPIGFLPDGQNGGSYGC